MIFKVKEQPTKNYVIEEKNKEANPLLKDRKKEKHIDKHITNK